MPLSPHPRRTIVAGWIALPLCVGIVILGAFMSGATYTPGTVITLGVALDAAVSTPISAAASSNGGLVAMYVAPVMVGSWVAYAAARERPRARRRLILRLSGAAFIGAALLAGGLGRLVVSPVLLLLSPLALAMPTQDPESYTDGLFCWYGVGAWIWLLILAYELDSRRPRLPAHLCQHCAYDRTGLDRAAACPECGGAGRPRPLIRRA